jgi:hypothetical protein
VLLGRRLLFHINEGQRPAAAPLVIAYQSKRGPVISLDYRPGEAPLLVDAALDRYYDEVAVAAGSEEKLRAIARVTRALQILQPFTDANSRLNVHTLMQKFLREQGFRPAVLMDSYSLFLGGYTVGEIAERLEEGMARFDQHVRWSGWDAFSQPQESLVARQADQLAAAMGITGATEDERRRQAIDTVRTARALFGHETTGRGEAVPQLAAIRALSQVAEERHPERAAYVSVLAYAAEVFDLPSVDTVNDDHLHALITAADRASAEGRPLRPDVLRDLAPTLPSDDSESASPGGGSVSDDSESASPGGGSVSDDSESVSDDSESASPGGGSVSDDSESVSPGGGSVSDDGRKPLFFLVSELAGDGPLRSAEDLVAALMPSLAKETLGGFRLVLRADAGSLGSDPAGLVSGLAAELNAPVELSQAGADGTMWRLRFDERGFRRDAVLLSSGVALRPTVRPDDSESASDGGGSVSGGSRPGGSVGEPDGQALEGGTAVQERKSLDFVVSELAADGSLGSVEGLVAALMPSLAKETLGGFRLVLRADAGSLGSDPAGLVSGLAAQLNAPVELLLAGSDGTVWRLRFDEKGSRKDMGRVSPEDLSASALPKVEQDAVGPVLGSPAFGSDLRAPEPEPVHTVPAGGPGTGPDSTVPYQPTGPATAELPPGTVFVPHPAGGSGDAFGEALARALEEAGVDLPVAAGGLRDWAVARVTEADLPDAALPPLDGTREVSLAKLKAARVQLDPGQEMRAVLEEQLPAGEFEPTPVERFRLLAGAADLSVDPVAASFAVDAAVAAAVARELGVAVAVAGPDSALSLYGPAPDTRLSVPEEGQPQ